jgi:hypothetical protein
MFLLAYDPASNPLNNNEWAFPLAEIIHIASYGIAIGTIALVDLRLLGLALVRQSTARLAQELAPWTLMSLVIVLISGPLIFSSDPNMYLRNQAFRFKIGALLLAIVYNYTLHRKVAHSPTSSPAVRRLTAAASLLLWVSVVFAGLFISDV